MSSNFELRPIRQVQDRAGQFELRLPPRILFGKGSLSGAGEVASFYGKKALIVIGKRSMKKTGVLDKLQEILKKEKVKFSLCRGIGEDSTIEDVDRVIECIHKYTPELVIALGGGSVLDAAKAASVYAKAGEKTKEYFDGNQDVAGKGVPFIAIPTTSGTGTEVTSVAVIRDSKRIIKKGLRSPYMIPDVALVDPLLTLNLPSNYTAFSGLDALTHAIEAYISLHSYYYTDLLALEAIRLIGRNLRPAVEKGKNVEAREGMALGSLTAGMAFANAGLGVVHALAHPIGARFSIPHGLACASVLPAVMAFNLSERKEKFLNISKALSDGKDGGKDPEDAVIKVRAIMQSLGVPRRLEEFGIAPADLETIVEETRYSGSLKSNPRPASPKDLLNILAESL